jgi:hypothetical protein
MAEQGSQALCRAGFLTFTLAHARNRNFESQRHQVRGIDQNEILAIYG